MKTLFFIAILLSYTAGVAQNKIEDKLTASVQAKYKGAEDIEWSESDEGYAVGFYVGDENRTAMYDAKGNWLRTEVSLSEDELPAAAKASIGKKYPEAYFDTVTKIENAEGTHLSAGIEHDGRSFLLEIANDGNIRKTTEIENQSEDVDWGDDE